MKRNAFGQLVLHPLIRFAGEGGEGGGKEFTPPASQEDLDKLINTATAKVHKRYEGFDDLKAKAEKWDEHESGDGKPKPEPKPKDDAANDNGLTEDDVQKRIDATLAAERLDLAIERVSDRLDKALEGRVFSASKLFALDRKQFVKDDGKTVDSEAIDAWVKDNTTEGEPDKGRRRIPGQGDRDQNASGGSVQAGRDLYDEKHSKNKSGKD